MFLNRKRDKLKIMGAGGKVLGYLRMPSGQRIMLDAIQFIPRTFGATGFNYDEALQQALGARLSAASRARSPLQAYRAMANAGLVDNRANV